MSGMTVGLIWAQSTSGVIGRHNGIPWRLPEDQARFKELTLAHTVVMGRITWESLPAKVKPLPGRRNVVVTRQAEYVADGATVVSSLEAALTGAGGPPACGGERSDSGYVTDDETWVIGGAQIYALALPMATRCEVTEVDVTLPREQDDAVAPVLDEAWVGTEGDWLTSAAGIRYRFLRYQRT
jgi:dihydrofolate reductase